MSELRLAQSLTLAAALIAALAIWLWLPENIASRRSPEAPSPAADWGVIASLPPLASFAATIERPLFSPSRRPAAMAPTALPGATIEIHYRLQGLITTGRERRALLKEAASQRKIEVGEGDVIEGWIVKQIEQDHLVLSSPVGEATLTLGRTGAASPAKP